MARVHPECCSTTSCGESRSRTTCPSTKVTQKNIKQFRARTPHTLRGGPCGSSIENVGWKDAVEFCQNLSKRERLEPRYRERMAFGQLTLEIMATGYRAKLMGIRLPRWDDSKVLHRRRRCQIGPDRLDRRKLRRFYASCRPASCECIRGCTICMATRGSGARSMEPDLLGAIRKQDRRRSRRTAGCCDSDDSFAAAVGSGAFSLPFRVSRS